MSTSSLDANDLEATGEAVAPQETAAEPLSSASADVSSENKAKADLDKKLSPASEEKRLSLKIVKVGLTKLESLQELKKDSPAAGDGEEPRTSASPPCEVSSTTLVESTASAVTAVTAVTTVTATATTSNTKTSTSGLATNAIIFC